MIQSALKELFQTPRWKAAASLYGDAVRRRWAVAWDSEEGMRAHAEADHWDAVCEKMKADTAQAARAKALELVKADGLEDRA